MLFGERIQQEPDFVNDQGVKWWLDHHSTSEAKKRGLSDVTVWIVCTPEEYYSRIILEGQEYEFESQQLEAIGTHLDLMKADREFP